MKIQIKSDTHNEFWWNKTRTWDPKSPDQSGYVNPEADVIVLAGDICAANSSIASLSHLYKDCGKPVIYIPGNHEYYGGNIHQYNNPDLGTLFRENNIHFLDCNLVEINEVIFIGATLWTYLGYRASQLAGSFSDMRRINGMSVHVWDHLYLKHRRFIKESLNSKQFKNKKKVVITHHLPSMQSVPIRFVGHELNDFFVSNQEELMKGENAPVLWIHGHTHDSFDYKVENCRVVCNPCGYYQENSTDALNPNFDPKLIVEI